MPDSTAAPQVFCKKMSGVYFSAISHCLRFQSRRRIRCSTFAYIILCNCSLYTLYPPVKPSCIVWCYQQSKRILTYKVPDFRVVIPRTVVVQAAFPAFIKQPALFASLKPRVQTAFRFIFLFRHRAAANHAADCPAALSHPA